MNKSESNILKEKSQFILNKNITSITRLTNGEYNKVYKIISEDNINYVIRLFRSKSWPEDGKLEWINNALMANNIDTAKILYYTREDTDFANGFMIQEHIDGDDIEDIINKRIDFSQFYSKLGELMKRVHKILIPNFGYIGFGDGNHPDFLSFIKNSLNDSFEEIEPLNIFEGKKQIAISKQILNALDSIKGLPSVLCHGDLSPDNTMLNKSDDLVLIDWDGAISSNWIYDFSQMTYWMRYRHDSENYQKLRKLFLINYKADFDLQAIDECEKALHTLQAISLLSYYYFDQNSKDSYNNTLEYLSKLT
jgi:aminoglycoside phosphotransferase (APT) family kinase protein